MSGNKGFLSGLFDFSFQTLITGHLIRLLYGLSVGVAAVFALFVLLTVSRWTNIVFGLILALSAFFGAIVYARVALELALVLFRIEENTRARERV